MTAVTINYMRHNYTYNMANHQTTVTFPHPLDTSRFCVSLVNISN